MRRLLALLSALLFLSFLAAPAAVAGEPHFINNAFSITRADDTLSVSAKEAGLGDEAQIHVLLSADAACINPGGNHPKAANKESFSTAADVPVQNGKAVYTLFLTATFQPSCSPPMTVQFSNVVLRDVTNNLTKTFPGTF
ncbi:MAG TPA: hypothetical protein VF314_17605 [Actinomycetes bacterium]